MVRKGKIMAHTDKLLSLVEQFPQAFSDSMEPAAPTPDETSTAQDQETVASVTTASDPETVAEDADIWKDEPKIQEEDAISSPNVTHLQQVTRLQFEGEDSPLTDSSGPVEDSEALTSDRMLHIVPPVETEPSTHQTQKVVPLQASQPQEHPSQDNLISLMQEFPQAFSGQEGTADGPIPLAVSSTEQAAVENVAEIQPETPDSGTEQTSLASTAETESLIETEHHFKEVEREGTLQDKPTVNTAAETEHPPTATLVDETDNQEHPEAPSSAPSIRPEEYDHALQRHIPTFTWGQVQVYFTYSRVGLRSIWVTVGKSGTEVQSLCEAIARLINLLLDNNVPVSDICRQIRGIRGADSEGLGPNRILGLADLIGKALQEAPETLSAEERTIPHPEGTTLSDADVNSHPQEDLVTSQASPTLSPNIDSEESGQAVASIEPPASSTSGTWTIPQGNLTAMLCPECGAELQHMNGCSGGACPVCGYSSCS